MQPDVMLKKPSRSPAMTTAVSGKVMKDCTKEGEMQYLVKAVISPLPVLAAHVEVHIRGATAAAVCLHSSAPLPTQILHIVPALSNLLFLQRRI